jgi:hypothetical protein
MTQDEIRAFLTEGTRTGKVASVRADGRPHVTPIWFVVDGDDLVFTIWHETVKARTFTRDPRIALCVDDEEPPYAFVIVEGEAELITEPDPDTRLMWATRIAERYMGADRAEEFGRRNGVEGEWIVRLKPSKIIAKKDVAG